MTYTAENGFSYEVYDVALERNGKRGVLQYKYPENIWAWRAKTKKELLRDCISFFRRGCK